MQYEDINGWTGHFYDRLFLFELTTITKKKKKILIYYYIYYMFIFMFHSTNSLCGRLERCLSGITPGLFGLFQDQL